MTLMCAYDAIGNVVFESYGARISIKISAIGGYRRLD